MPSSPPNPSKSSSSPTPSERERNDAELREQEATEQAALPYKWSQTIGDVDISVPVPGKLRGRDVEVVLLKRELRVAVRGQEAIVDVLFTPSSPPLYSPFFFPPPFLVLDGDEDEDNDKDDEDDDGKALTSSVPRTMLKPVERLG